MLDPLHTLAQINLDDLVDAFGLRNAALLAPVLRRVCRGPARELAARIVRFDGQVGAHGLASAARELQRGLARDVRVFGRERLPRGPLLVLSNHPGLTDTLSLFSALDRDDLRVIARPRPFLQALPNIERQLLYVAHDRSRLALVRKLRAHLRAGGAVLTFPAGQTEPDPQVYGGALHSLAHWSDGVGVFMRLASETAVVPVVVRSVTWPIAARHPLTRLRRARADRELLAAALQLLIQISLNVRLVTTRVEFGRPISAQSLGTTDSAEVHAAVLAQMQHLLAHPAHGSGVSVL